MDTDLSEVTPGQKHTLEMGQAKDEADKETPMDFGKSLLYIGSNLKEMPVICIWLLEHFVCVCVSAMFLFSLIIFHFRDGVCSCSGNKHCGENNEGRATLTNRSFWF